MAQIALASVQKSFGDFMAVRNSTFTIEHGQFFVLLGPSGCGKTTTLRMIAGLELPTAGEIRLDGEDVTFRRARERDIAFVFQLFALYPHMTVRRNIGFPLLAQGVPGREIRRRVEETAKLLRIDHLLDRGVGGLAGGDRQRVALGRAIVRRPKAFLMDEPLGTLDAAFRELMCEELRQLHDRIGATTVYVTHDQIEAMAMADVIAVMDKGRVLQTASPYDIYHRPTSLFVASFIGSPAMSFLDAEGGLGTGADRVRLGGADLAMPALHEAATAPRLTLGVRPEHVRLDDAGPLRGRVTAVEYTGAREIVSLDTAAGPIRLRARAGSGAAVGQAVGVSLDPSALVLFDPGSGAALRSALFDAESGGRRAPAPPALTPQLVDTAAMRPDPASGPTLAVAGHG